MIVDVNLPKYTIIDPQTEAERQMSEREATHAEAQEITENTYARVDLKHEIRSYEVSLWTLQDEFITVLKWSDAEQQGRIQDPEMTLNVDGTQNFKFSIPMYLESFAGEGYAKQRVVIENPIWYNTKNGNLIEGMRKVKVIFNKMTQDEGIYEFVITKVTEEHQSDQLFCRVECEGLAFHELGKIGYKINLSEDNYLLNYEEWYNSTSSPKQWTKADGTICTTEPRETLDYWCEQCYLEPWTNGLLNPRKWYYKIEMNWDSFQKKAYNGTSNVNRVSTKVYEDEYATSWDSNLKPLATEYAREKNRPVSVSESNIYNITQTIAETFNIYCKYVYGYDENYHIISRTVVFYNNYVPESQKIINLTYPYTSKSVSRELDSTEITTKMFVRGEDNEGLLGGIVNIMNSPANKTKEDYLLNFEYMYKQGAINKEQYDEIEEYEKYMHTTNSTLEGYSYQLNGYNTQKIDVEANIKILEKSIEVAQEELDNYNDLYNRLDESMGDADGYFERTADTNYATIAITDKDTGGYTIRFNDQDKGLLEASIKVYKTYTPSADDSEQHPKLSDQITIQSSWYKKDKYGDIIAINLPSGTFGSGDSKKVYIIYKYSPRLYYASIYDMWLNKKAADATELETEEAALANIEENIASTTALYDALLIKKNARIREFEQMMGPALREGYWQPESYQDYGERKSANAALPSSFNSTAFDANAGDGIIVNWDAELFDSEDKLYYEEGVDLQKNYYPCIDISGYLTGNSNIADMMNNADGQLCFIANNNYYKDLTNAEQNQIQNLVNFTLHGGMQLGFIRNSSNAIKPVLILTGTKNMTEEEIKFILTRATGKGNPRLCVFSAAKEVNGNNIIVTSANEIEISAGNIYWLPSKLSGCNNVTTAAIVYPRVKFSDMRLKTDSSYLGVAYNNDDNILTRYEDYNVLTRVTDRPECYITIKPEVLINAKTITGQVYVKYTLSNAATSIYLDAKEILKENSEPKVSYNVEVSVLNEDYIRILYSMLTQIVIINDVDLKFEDVYGYISQIDLKLDKPWEDTIEVKNYKTKFEDLFSTIVAQTEEMKKNSAAYGQAATGDVSLSADALAETLQNEQVVNILNAYLDSHFDGSEVVQEKLASLFEEAGEILADSNSALNNIRNISEENATILNSFARKISSEMTPRVYNSTTQPSVFKSGDIWNQIDNSGKVIARYVATSNSEDANGGGWTRVYDGSLAAITGADLNIDAVAGTIEILAKNSIDIKTGGYLYLAGENVDIVGNKQINIGGATINIASVSREGSTYAPQGINLITTNAHVYLKPNHIEMAGSVIEMYAGTSSSAAAIKLNAAQGIHIGSGNEVRIFSNGLAYNSSGNLTTTGANISVTPTKVFMGVASGTAASAVDIEASQIILATGTNSSFSTSDVTLNATGSLTGLKLKKDSFGFAVNSGSSRAVMLANDKGITVGTGETPKSSGSYVTISGSGVEIGSSGNLYVNMNNFKLQTDGTYGTRFAVGSNLNSVNIATLSSTSGFVGLVYNTNGLYINGNVYATTFVAPGNSQQFRASSNELGFYTTAGAAITTFSSGGVSVASGYTLSINGNINLSATNLTIKSSPASGENYFYVGSGGTGTNDKYIRYTQAGSLEVKGVITATSFTLTGSSSGISYNDLSDKPTIPDASSFTTNGLGYVEDWADTGKNYVTLTSTGGLLIGGNINNGTGNSIIIPSAANSAANPYLKIDENGIELNGKHIKINGEQEWSRDDIIVMNPNDASSWRHDVASIESHMSGRTKDWVLIRPYYNARLDYFNDSMQFVKGGEFTVLFDTTEADPIFGDGATGYTCDFSCDVVISEVTQNYTNFNITLQYKHDGSTEFTPIAFTRDNTTALTDNVVAGTVDTTLWTDSLTVNHNLRLRMDLGTTNLCKSKTQFRIYFRDRTGLRRWQISSMKLIFQCNATKKCVPCTVYYYPYIPST